MTKSKTDTMIRLFWTGGWDSTFRLLYLLVAERKQVQPYYIVDANRASTLHELKAMETIKAEINRAFPYTRELLLPIILFSKSDITPVDKYQRAWKNLQSYTHIGSQYVWLACFAHQFDISKIELCIDSPALDSDSATYLVRLCPELKGKMHACRLRDHLTNQDLSLFRNFRFPVVHLSKKEMQILSEQYNFFSTLCKTWFCHHPKPFNLPCGICKPCMQRKESGVPISSHYSKTSFFRNLFENRWHSFKNALKKIRLAQTAYHRIYCMHKNT